jgi:hypothetical protein
MQTYDLTVMDADSFEKVATFPPANEPYGHFASGETLFVDRHPLVINRIAHAVVPQANGHVLCRTALFVTAPVPAAAGGEPAVASPW